MDVPAASPCRPQRTDSQRRQERRRGRRRECRGSPPHLCPPLRRRLRSGGAFPRGALPDDGYCWLKYGEKRLARSGNSKIRSYFKCASSMLRTTSAETPRPADSGFSPGVNRSVRNGNLFRQGNVADGVGGASTAGGVVSGVAQGAASGVADGRGMAAFASAGAAPAFPSPGGGAAATFPSPGGAAAVPFPSPGGPAALASPGGAAAFASPGGAAAFASPGGAAAFAIPGGRQHLPAQEGRQHLPA
ncbi:unnamed protein product [Closterium sp. NIES-65]|nr:unnamed protein product [Closterium sp. NIES-65]